LTTGDRARLFLFLASAVSLLLAGVTLTAGPNENLAWKSHCWKAAEDKYGLKLLKGFPTVRPAKRLGRPPTSRLRIFRLQGTRLGGSLHFAGSEVFAPAYLFAEREDFL
jgi:hypothetical protein